LWSKGRILLSSQIAWTIRQMDSIVAKLAQVGVKRLNTKAESATCATNLLKIRESRLSDQSLWLAQVFNSSACRQLNDRLLYELQVGLCGTLNVSLCHCEPIDPTGAYEKHLSKQMCWQNSSGFTQDGGTRDGAFSIVIVESRESCEYPDFSLKLKAKAFREELINDQGREMICSNFDQLK